MSDVERLDWPYEAVVHGARVDRDCLALTGSGKPCSYNAYASNDRPACNTHADVDDPDVVEHAHQWARISDPDQGCVTVCVNCRAVWHGNEPETAVDCPECKATAGERCRDESSTYSAPIPPHPARRREAYDTVDDFEPCTCNPTQDLIDDDQQRLQTDGGRELPTEFERFVETDGDDELPCRGCGDSVRRRYLENRLCPGCRYRVRADGGLETVTEHRAICQCGWESDWLEDLSEAKDARYEHEQRRHNGEAMAAVRTEQKPVATDGGRYTHPTGPGYLGVYRVDGNSVGIPIGIWEHLPWLSTTDVWAITEDLNGSTVIAVVADEPDDPICELEAKHNTCGTIIQVFAEALRELNPTYGEEVRVYRRAEGGFYVVPRKSDPTIELAPDHPQLVAEAKRDGDGLKLSDIPKGWGENAPVPEGAGWDTVAVDPPKPLPDRVTPGILRDAVEEHDSLFEITRDLRASRESVRMALHRLGLLDDVGPSSGSDGELRADGGIDQSSSDFYRSDGRCSEVSCRECGASDDDLLLGIDPVDDTILVGCSNCRETIVTADIRDAAVDLTFTTGDLDRIDPELRDGVKDALDDSGSPVTDGGRDLHGSQPPASVEPAVTQDNRQVRRWAGVSFGGLGATIAAISLAGLHVVWPLFSVDQVAANPEQAFWGILLGVALLGTALTAGVFGLVAAMGVISR